MICGHCDTRNVNIHHVRACSSVEQRIRSIGATEVQPDPVLTLADAEKQGIDLTGFYIFKDGEGNPLGYYRVRYSSQRRPYVSRLLDGSWVYEGRRPLYTLRVEDRINADDAAEFGHRTGQCVFCLRHLTDERSVSVGYGPICAGNNGLPWGE